jgi:hypothetical protein
MIGIAITQAAFNSALLIASALAAAATAILTARTQPLAGVDEGKTPRPRAG